MKHARTGRREWLAGAAGLALAGGFGWRTAQARQSGEGVEGMTAMTDLANAPLNAPGFEERTDADWAALSRDEWRARLTEQQFYVLRKEGTERAFTSPLNDEKRAGWFACAGCGYVLFRSTTKYDSGTGWPSFYDAIEGRLDTKTDFKLIYPRTEYHCARCGGHQGHVFKDGPAPTGLRYCNNGVALVFFTEAEAG